MSVLHLACVLISLLSFSAAAPTTNDCSQLTQPLTPNELHQILGRWILIEAISNNDIFDSVLMHLDSSWMTLNTTGEKNTLLFDQANLVQAPEFHPETQQPQKPETDQTVSTEQTVSTDEEITIERVETLLPARKDRCIRATYNVTLVDGKVLEFHFEPGSTYNRFLQTCHDCLLMHIYTKVNTYRALFVFGRSTTLAASDLETFRKQAACLRFPLPAKFHYDTNKELCPV